MIKEILIIGPRSIAEYIKSGLIQGGYAVYVITNYEDLNLHDFSNTTAIIDFNTFESKKNVFNPISHNTKTVKTLLDIASRNNTRYLFLYPWETRMQDGQLNWAKNIIEQYSKHVRLDYSIVEVSDIYGVHLNTSNLLNSIAHEIVRSQKITVKNDEQNINLLNERDFIPALISLVDDVGSHAKKYRIGPFEMVKIIELAHFAKEITDLPISVEYKTEGSPGRDLDTLDATPTPPGWEPKVSLEVGLKDLFERKGIPIPENASAEKREEDIKLTQEQLSLRGNAVKLEVFQDVISESLPLRNETMEESIAMDLDPNLNSESSALVSERQTLPFVSSTLVSTLPSKSSTAVKKTGLSSKTKVISLAILLFLLTFIPSVIYANNLYKSISKIEIATKALSTGDFTKAKENSELAKTSIDSLSNIPWPVSLSSKTLGYSTQDSTAIINNLSNLANLITDLARLNESYTNKAYAQTSANVLGASTLRDESAVLTKAITTIETLNNNKTSDNDFLSKRIQNLIAQTSKSTATLKKINNIESQIPVMLGYDNPQKYLVLIQNSHELRATGGAIESLGILKIDKGNLTISDFIDSNNTNVQLELNETGAIPPLPIREIFKVNELYIKDAGWNPDFPTSAELIAKLYTSATSNKVDGVIAVDIQTLKNLLNLYGSINVSDYDTSVNPVNLENTINAKFATDSLLRNSFLTKLSSGIFTKLTQKGHMDTQTLQTIYANLESKDLLIFSKNDLVETALVKNDWAGSVQNSQDDFLYIIDSNMGSKTANSFITREIEYLGFEPQVNTGYLRKVKIKYKHSGTPNPQIYQDYLNHLRIIVPENTFLNSAKVIKGENEKTITRDVKVTPYGKKALYSTDLLVKPGEDITVEIEYESPKRSYENDIINLKIQKQPGTIADKLKVVFTYPFGIPKDIKTTTGQIENNSIKFESDLRITRDFEFPL